MRLVRRIIVNMLILVSLIVCIATAALWVRSYFQSDWLLVTNGPSGHELTSYRGRLIYLHWRGIASPSSVRFESESQAPTGVLAIEEASDRRFLGFTVPHGSVSGPDAEWWPWACPLWVIVLLTGIAPVARLWGYRRQRHPGQQCAICNYDLRATPDRCPECGTVPAQVNLARSISADPFSPLHRRASHTRRTNRR